MTDKQTGGQAFPLMFTHATTQPGMTLRDYFAAKAMQAYLPDAMNHNATEGELAWSAYKMADAMLKARNGNP